MPRLSNQRAIDAFNTQLRSNPQYQAFLRSMGVNTQGPIRLNDRQRKAAENWVRRTFGDIGNLQIDPAGNVNQDEGFSKHAKWAIPAAIGAGTLGFGAAGMGPLAGLFGGAGAGAGAGTGSALAAPTAAQSASGIASLAGMGLPGGVAGGTAAALGAAPAGVNAALGSRLLRGLLSPEGLTAAGTIAAALAARGDGTNAATRASEDQARRMQALTEARMRRVDPLHEAITQLAFSRLPVSSRQGLALPRVALPEG